MKTILVFAIIGSFILLIFVIWHKLYSEPQPYNEFDQEFSELQDIPELVKEYNDINKHINSLSENHAAIKMWNKGMKVSSHGLIQYEKPLSFQMVIRSGMGEEINLGSNDKIFWYWSRRDKEPGVYYATYANYTKTGLKTPFNPIFLRASLGIDEIDISDAKISESEHDILIAWEKESSTGGKIIYSVLLNKSNKRMVGIVITDLAGVVLASAKMEYDGIIVKKIVYDWKEEDRSLEVKFSKPIINKSWDASRWNMPDYHPKIDMGKS